MWGKIINIYGINTSNSKESVAGYAVSYRDRYFDYGLNLAVTGDSDTSNIGPNAL